MNFYIVWTSGDWPGPGLEGPSIALGPFTSKKMAKAFKLRAFAADKPFGRLHLPKARYLAEAQLPPGAERWHRALFVYRQHAVPSGTFAQPGRRDYVQRFGPFPDERAVAAWIERQRARDTQRGWRFVTYSIGGDVAVVQAGVPHRGFKPATT